MSEKTHSRVWEYDGAVICMDCGSRWGAFPNVSKNAPPICDRWNLVREKIKEINSAVASHQEFINKELDNLKELAGKAALS